jgi:hypothetical protein
MPAPLERTSVPGIYKRGSRYVVTYRLPGSSTRKAFAPSMKRAA